VLRFCTPSGHLPDKPGFNAGYMGVWLSALLVMWLFVPVPEPWSTIFVVLAFFRWLEIAIFSLGLALAKTTPKGGSSLVTVGVYALQMVFIFAIAEGTLATNNFVADSGPAARPFDYIYVSWSNMTTIGSEYTPNRALAQGLRLGAVTSGVLLLGVVVARTLEEVKKTERDLADVHHDELHRDLEELSDELASLKQAALEHPRVELKMARRSAEADGGEEEAMHSLERLLSCLELDVSEVTYEAPGETVQEVVLGERLVAVRRDLVPSVVVVVRTWVNEHGGTIRLEMDDEPIEVGNAASADDLLEWLLRHGPRPISGAK
jgi:hypothetical protein